MLPPLLYQSNIFSPVTRTSPQSARVPSNRNRLKLPDVKYLSWQNSNPLLDYQEPTTYQADSQPQTQIKAAILCVSKQRVLLAKLLVVIAAIKFALFFGRVVFALECSLKFTFSLFCVLGGFRYQFWSFAV